MAKPVEVSETAGEEAAEGVHWHRQRDERVAADFAEEFAAAIETVG